MRGRNTVRENEHRQTIVLFALVVLASSVGNLAQTGLNAMLSSVCAEFGIAEGVGQWLTTSYMLVLGRRCASVFVFHGPIPS